ncbi:MULTISPECIES: hypothetical protein [unclassified Natrinema]|uniref:hypothetical protein n=1 Tax=unclassified Natrinema TaxID=2622230 RepID=UPI00026D51AF|nr:MULTISPECIES: hypothetical protein [unclassified Natrinema]AFO56029.1 hypothetical protein NJ7G_0780 [Natrinema sp. J7-2]
MTGYYDIVLGLIPVALLGITAALLFVGLSLTTAIPLGSLAAMGIIGHAMFVNTPVDSGDESRSAQPPINAD